MEEKLVLTGKKLFLAETVHFVTTDLSKARRQILKGWLLRRQLYLNYQLTIDPAKILIGSERVKLFSSNRGKTQALARGSPFLWWRETDCSVFLLFN